MDLQTKLLDTIAASAFLQTCDNGKFFQTETSPQVCVTKKVRVIGCEQLSSCMTCFCTLFVFDLRSEVKTKLAVLATAICQKEI